MSKNHGSGSAARTLPEADDALQHLFYRHFAVELASSHDQINEVLALRYQVYCRERPFEDANCFPDGRERDAYDKRSVHALVRHRDSRSCVAAVRLVLTDKQDPAALFPVEAHCGDAIPAAGAAELAGTPRSLIAEISRLAISRNICQQMRRSAPAGAGSNGSRGGPTTDSHVLPCIVLGLFSAIVRLSTKLGITHWMAVMEPTLLRLLKRYGIHFGHVGDVVDYHGRRRPAIARARTLIDGIQAVRPQVWDLITDAGTVLPSRPVIVQPRPTAPVRTPQNRAIKNRLNIHSVQPTTRAVAGVSG